MTYIPTQIEPFSPKELFVAWNNGEKYSIPYVELRFYCPCAGCVDENTGQRTIQKTSIHEDVRPTQVQLIGRYAVQITWSDGHDTGMYHYDRIFELSHKAGKKLSP
jgi:DUF971 family protein